MSGVSVTIGANAAAALAALEGMARKAETIAERIKKGFAERVGHRLFDGLTRAAAALPGAMKDAIDAGGRLSDQMARTGASGEKLVILERALKNAGVGAEKTVTLLGLMQKALAGINDDSQSTTEAFGVLGLSMEGLRAQDPVDAMQAIGAAIMGIEDPAQRTALAMRTFGGAGAEALVLFADGKAFANAANQLGSLPAVLAKNAARLDEVSERLGNLNTGWQQLATSAAAAVLPAIERITARLQGMDLARVGEAIGAVINGFVEFQPAIMLAVSALAALKLSTFITALGAKAAAWWTATAAVRANTAALRENAAAGATAGKPGAAAGGMGLLAGGALMVAAVGLQLLQNETQKLEAANAALAQSFERTTAAVEKFQVSAMRGQVASRAEIEKTIATIREEQEAISKAASEQAATIEDPATAARVLEDARTSNALLETKAKLLRNTSDAQLAANQAARDAAKAEADYQAAMEKSIETYRAARETYEKSLAANERRRVDALPLEEQIEELRKAEAEVRAAFNSQIQTNFAGKSAAEIAAALQSSDNFTTRGEDMETVNRLLDIETRRAEVQKKLAAAKQEEAKAAATAAAEYQRQLDEAAAELSRAREEARKSSAALVDEAEAMLAGPEAMAALALRRRAAELQDQTGMGNDEATGIARREQAFERLREMQQRQSGLRYESAFSQVDSMRRIGGGGGVASSGLDYARQQTDLQRQMVDALRGIRDIIPRPSLED
jgi:hypothetical protein